MRSPARILSVLLSGLLVALPGCLDADPAPDDEEGAGQAVPDAELRAALEELAAMPELRFDTDHGTVRVLLYDAWLPRTTQHITDLARSGFYDGTTIHRVVDDFVIQGGDPSGTGQLGSGETVPLERDARLRFAAGAVGLARDVDPDSGDSQWFITETPQPHLSDPEGATGTVFGAYALFGQVFEGLPVVRSVAAEPTVPGADRPVEDVVVRTVEVLPPPEDADLLGVVRAIEPGVAWTRGVGTLDRPLWIVAGHPVRLLVHDAEDTGEGFDPRGAAWTRDGHDAIAVAWSETTDPGTWEATVTFPAPGAWTLAATDVVRAGQAPVVVEVLPWHDAYAPYAPAPAGAA